MQRRRLVQSGLVLMVGAVLLWRTEAAVAQRVGVAFLPRGATPHYDGRFMFTRLKYTVGPGGYYYRNLPAWAHGFPEADDNLMKIMGAITALDAHADESQMLAIDDPNLGKFPVAFMTEAGYWVTNDKEAAAFGAYLRKGGFVIFDDFRDPPRGGGGLPNLEANLGRAIPGARLLPMNPVDGIFHVFFDINSFGIIPQWYDLVRPQILGLYEDNDRRNRLMAIVNFNTDISNYWEFSAEGLKPVPDTNEAYKLGVNYITH